MLDAEAGDLLLQTDPNRAKGRFGRAVEVAPWHVGPRGHAADGDKEAGALFAEVGKDGAVEIEGPEEVGLELCWGLLRTEYWVTISCLWYSSTVKGSKGRILTLPPPASQAGRRPHC